MGVDHTAFAYYGVAVKISIRALSDDKETIEASIPDALDVELVEWGSRQYGGAFGFALMLKESYTEIDFDRGVGIRALPRAYEAVEAAQRFRLESAATAITKAGVACTCVGEFGWFVGGRTW